MSTINVYSDINHIKARLLNENDLAMVFIKNPEKLAIKYYKEKYVIYAKDSRVILFNYNFLVHAFTDQAELLDIEEYRDNILEIMKDLLETGFIGIGDRKLIFNNSNSKAMENLQEIKEFLGK